MKLDFSPTAWLFRSPSGGAKYVMDSNRVCLYGAPLSYSAYDCEVPISSAWVKLEAACQTENLTSPKNAATVMLSFYTSDGKPLRRQYIEPTGDNDRLYFSRVFEVPKGTAKGVVTLALRWPQGGKAYFNAPAITPAEPPAERKARVVITHFQIGGGNWYERINNMFEEIGPTNPDIVCLSECMHTRNIPANKMKLAAEPINGSFVSLLSGLAKQYRTYVTGNFLEADGNEIFNTSVLLGRDGSLVGSYRKVHLPLTEIEFGTSPGGAMGQNAYPVFETDFARVGLTVCWDAVFPEAARLLRLNGAELIISATMGDFWPVDAARARDNGLWFAIAGQDRYAYTPYPPSRLYNPVGEVVCSCGMYGGADSFTFADIDFNGNFYQRYISVGPCEGELPSLFITERRPDTY